MSRRKTKVSVSTFANALAVQKKASLKGLDWADPCEVLTKIREELDEVEEAVQCRAKNSLEQEVGDLLFSVVNFARMLLVDPEDALKDAINKFERRFRGVLALIERSGQKIDGMSVEELDLFWEAAKRTESSEEARRSY